MASIADQLALGPSKYDRTPLQVTEYDCEAHRPVRSAILIGNVPKGVLQATQRGTITSATGSRGSAKYWPVTKWSAKDAKILEGYFGGRWEDLLTPDVSFLSRPTATGGNSIASLSTAGGSAVDTAELEDEISTVEEADFGDLSKLNILTSEGEPSVEALDEDGAVIISQSDLQERAARIVGDVRATSQLSGDYDSKLPEGDIATLYSPLAVHNIDTVADLSARIYLALGIPPYRQHLFWRNENLEDHGSPPITSYAVTVGGQRERLDIRHFGESDSMHVADIPIDKDLALEQERGNVFVEGRDHFIHISSAAGGLPIRRVFVVDIERIIAPRRSQVIAEVADDVRRYFLYHGFVNKYWPQYSGPAFIEYLKTPAALAASYPRLAFGVGADSRRALEAQVSKQDAIMATTEQQSAAALRRYAVAGSVAVTSATVVVDPRRVVRGRLASGVTIDIRNMFDLFATTSQRPAIAARFFLSASGRGRQDMGVVKKHITTEPGGNDDSVEIGRLCQRTIKRHTAMIIIRADHPFSIAAATKAAKQNAAKAASDKAMKKGGDAAGGPTDKATPPTGLIEGDWIRGRARLIIVTIRSDGYYTAEATWAEDQRMSPDAVVQSISAIIMPTIQGINQMGASVFPIGGTLRAVQTGPDVKLEGMVASFYWPHSINDEAFRQIKTRWREYEVAGMVTIKGLQQAGAFAFQFLKGIIDYDPRAIERTIIVSTTRDASGRERMVREISDRTQSTYSFLTDDTIAARWECIYGGRTVRLTHRSTDMRVDVIGANEDELRIIWNVVFAFLHSAIYGADKIPGALQETVKRKGGLKALQDSDPNLFDLRRYDRKATVYSVLCQNPRPPIAYSPDEAAALPEKQRKRLVKYWNFTHNRPAFYDCANPKFPHLSFLEGRHSEGYCLPCCQKTVAHRGSRRDIINQRCLAAFANGPSGEFDEGDIVDVSSRHMLAYGKRVPPGRVATLARTLEEGIFYHTLEDHEDYHLMGVSQSLASIPESGLFYTIAGALGIEPDELAQTMASGVIAMGSEYASLVSGTIGTMFASAPELAAAIINTFTSREGGIQFTEFSPGGQAHDAWEDLVINLVGLIYSASLIIFHDPDGSARNIHVEFPPATVTWLKSGLARAYIIAFDVGQSEGKLMSGGEYPLVRFRKGGELTGVWSSDDPIVENLRVMANYGDKSEHAWTASILAEALGSKTVKGYTPKLKLIGMRSRCYGVILSGPNGAVHVPVESSFQSDKDILEHMGAGVRRGVIDPKMLGSMKATQDLLAALSKWGVSAGTTFHPQALLMHGGQYIGVRVAIVADITVHLNFYHSASKSAITLSSLERKRNAMGLEKVDYPMLPWVVDASIWNGPVPAAELSPEGQWELYMQVLYQLFSAEFISLVNQEKDEVTRKRVIAALRTRRPRAAVRKVLTELKAARSTYKLLQDDAESLMQFEQNTRGIDDVVFHFDRKLLERFQVGEVGEGELDTIMRKLVDVAPSADIRHRLEGVQGINIFASCKERFQAGQTEPPCFNGRLLVPQEEMARLVSLLMADLKNPMTTSVITLAAAGVLDDANFIRRPGETVFIKF